MLRFGFASEEARQARRAGSVRGWFFSPPGFMRDAAQAPRGGGGFFSSRSLSNYMRIVSSGASTAASTLRSAGASLVNSIASHDEDGSRDQVRSLALLCFQFQP